MPLFQVRAKPSCRLNGSAYTTEVANYAKLNLLQANLIYLQHIWYVKFIQCEGVKNLLDASTCESTIRLMHGQILVYSQARESIHTYTYLRLVNSKVLGFRKVGLLIF